MPRSLTSNVWLCSYHLCDVWSSSKAVTFPKALLRTGKTLCETWKEKRNFGLNALKVSALVLDPGRKT